MASKISLCSVRHQAKTMRFQIFAHTSHLVFRSHSLALLFGLGTVTSGHSRLCHATTNSRIIHNNDNKTIKN